MDSVAAPAVSIIGSLPSPPKKSFPADNSPAKIRPVRWPPVRGRFLPVNFRPGDGSDFIMERLFYGAGDILLRGRHIKSVIIFPRADLSWGRHFNVTPAALSVIVIDRRRHCQLATYRFDTSDKPSGKSHSFRR